MDILVTGGAGFIGSHLTEKLLSQGHAVTIYDNFMRNEESKRNVKEVRDCNKVKNLSVLDANILDFEKLKRAISEKDIVYHLAALPSHRLALKEPREYAMVDVLGTVNVLEAARLSGTNPKVVFASSNKVYGKHKPPFKETMTPQPEGPYGLSKYCSEEFCRMYAEYYGLDAPAIRYHHVIGPRCQPDRELSIFTERVINNLPPIVHGKWENGKFVSCAADYTNIYDVIEATMLVGEKIKKFEAINLATGKVTTVLKIAEIVIELLGKNDIKPEYRGMLPHETLVHQSDVSKIKTLLGFEAKTGVKDSIKQYIEWRLKIGPRGQAIYKEG